MDDNLDRALEVDVLAAALRMNRQEAGDLLEFLAQKLEQALPQNTTVTRGGWFLSKEHPVQEITVHFDNYQYKISREQRGSFTAKVMKLVRGVVLKTTEIPIDQWTDEVAQQIAELAKRSSQTRSALNKFVIG